MRGFNWGLTTAYGQTISSPNSGESDSFSETLSGLSCKTTYHYRAFATNNEDTGYGTDNTFTTPACTSRSGGSGSGSGSGSSSSYGSSIDIPPATPETDQLTPSTTDSPDNTQNTDRSPANNNSSRQYNISSTFKQDIDYGDSSEDVRLLQKFLNSQGYTITPSGPGSPGNETTLFGRLTRQALRRFQIDNNILPASGILDSLTRAAINLKLN